MRRSRSSSLAVGSAVVILVGWAAVFVLSPASTRLWTALVLFASAGLTLAQMLRHRRTRQRAAGGTPETTAPPQLRDYVVPFALPPSALLVGRDDELAVIRAGVRRPEPAGPRLVSIWGPPGIGKTALAITAAHQLADEFPH